MFDLSVRQLEYFVAVAEEGSVTEAARRLYISPAGVSLAISQLEKNLDVQLTLRVRGKGVALTPAGRVLYKEVQNLAENFSRVKNITHALRGELIGPLRVGCFSTLSPWLIPTIVEHFQATYPAVTLDFVEGVTSDLVTKLQEGEIDVALIYKNHVEPGIDYTEIMPVRLQVALAPDHPLASYEEIQLSMLDNEVAILLGVQPSKEHVEEIMRAANVRPNVKWTSTNVETIRSMVARGLGYSIIMGRPHGETTYDGHAIVYKKIADQIESNAVVLAYPDGLKLNTKIQTLIDFCKQEFDAHSVFGRGIKEEKR